MIILESLTFAIWQYSLLLLLLLTNGTVALKFIKVRARKILIMSPLGYRDLHGEWDSRKQLKDVTVIKNNLSNRIFFSR